MPELEERLRFLGAAIQYPPTPALARTVSERLAAESARRRPALTLRRVALAFAAVAVAVAAALLVSPQARTTVLGWLGLKGVLVQPVKKLPSPTPGPSGLALRLELGQPVSLLEAEGKVAYHLAIPQSLGSPDHVYFLEPPAGGEISLAYSSRPGLPATKETELGLLMMQFRGDINPDFLGKLLGPGTNVEELTVNGNRGFWISGAPHGFLYNDPNGDTREETFRLAGNTLLWEQGGLTLRIESALTRDQALAIARTVR